MNEKTYTVTLEEGENGDAVMPIPVDLIDELKWKEGDKLNWHDNKDGTFSLSKSKEEDVETEMVLVEAILAYRMRYVVEVPKGKSVYASDTVISQEAEEFSQLALDEVITSTRVIDEKEFIRLCNEDNDYASGWDDARKKEVFLTTWNSIKDK